MAERVGSTPFVCRLDISILALGRMAHIKDARTHSHPRIFVKENGGERGIRTPGTF